MDTQSHQDKILPLIKLDYEVNDLEEKVPKRPKNDIRDIKGYKQLEKVQLDLESPRFIKACVNLGISVEECHKKYDIL